MHIEGSQKQETPPPDSPENKQGTFFQSLETFRKTKLGKIAQAAAVVGGLAGAASQFGNERTPNISTETTNSTEPAQKHPGSKENKNPDEERRELYGTLYTLFKKLEATTPGSPEWNKVKADIEPVALQLLTKAREPKEFALAHAARMGNIEGFKAFTNQDPGQK